MRWLSQTMPLNYVQRATNTLPQTTQKPLFAITGRVLITHLLGEVTTAIGAVADATKLCYRTEAGVSSDLCATNDIQSDVVASYYTITGTAATAMVNSATAPVIKLATSVALDAGTIDLNCAGSTTGSIKWLVGFVPLEPGAIIIPL